jgi:hypothetical protein
VTSLVDSLHKYYVGHCLMFVPEVLCMIWECSTLFMYIGELVMKIMYMLVQTGSVESIVSYCCLCTVVFYNLRNVCNAAMVLFIKNFYLQDRKLIVPYTKMSWNDFENGSSESERTLQVIECCTTIMRQLTQCFQL